MMKRQPSPRKKRPLGSTKPQKANRKDPQARIAELQAFTREIDEMLAKREAAVAQAEAHLRTIQELHQFIETSGVQKVIDRDLLPDPEHLPQDVADGLDRFIRGDKSGWEQVHHALNGYGISAVGVMDEIAHNPTPATKEGGKKKIQSMARLLANKNLI